jgi:hypothetical protein
MGSPLEFVKCEKRRARIETLESDHFVAERHRVLEGFVYYEPVQECHFVLYRDDDKLMRTSEILEVYARTNETIHFRTHHTKYRLTWL